MSNIQKMLDMCYDDVELHHSFALNWSLKGKGFGQLYFYVDNNKNLRCSNEMLSKDSIKRILNLMVDQCILEDTKC